MAMAMGQNLLLHVTTIFWGNNHPYHPLTSYFRYQGPFFPGKDVTAKPRTAAQARATADAVARLLPGSRGNGFRGSLVFLR